MDKLLENYKLPKLTHTSVKILKSKDRENLKSHKSKWTHIQGSISWPSTRNNGGQEALEWHIHSAKRTDNQDFYISHKEWENWLLV